MPDPGPRFPIWLIFTPWRYNRPWSRFVGFMCLVVIAYGVVALIVGGPLNRAAWWPPCFILVLVSVDLIKDQLDARKFNKTMKTLDTWSATIAGTVQLQDLAPEQQEDIAIQRSLARTELWEPPRD
jgi:hypothetical protein